MKRTPYPFIALVSLALIAVPPLAAQSTNERALQVFEPQFNVRFESGAIVGLKPTMDSQETEFIMPGRRLGDVAVRYHDHGSGLSFMLERDNPEKHFARLRVGGLTSGSFAIKDERSVIREFSVAAGGAAVIKLPMEVGLRSKRFTIVAHQ